MTLHAGFTDGPPETFQHSASSTRSFDEVLGAVRGAIDGAGMKVLHEIDPQAALKGIEQTMGGGRLVFFFHPSLLARLLQIEWSAVVEVPLKLVILERMDGTVSIRMANPTVAFARYGNPTLTAFGHELDTACGRIIAACL